VLSDLDEIGIELDEFVGYGERGIFSSSFGEGLGMMKWG